MQRNVEKQKIEWNGNVSQAIQVADYINVGITAVGTGDITVLASKDKELVDFSLPSTIDNSYAQVVIFDETVVSSPFVTGLTVSSSTKIGEIDTNLITWIQVVRSAGSADAFVTYSTNQ